MNAATATYTDDRYRFSWPDIGIEVVLDRIADSRSGLTGEISISSASLGKLHSPSRFNVLAPQTRATLARQLAERDTFTDWGAVLEQVCALTIQRWREGEPVIDLRDVEPGAARWLYEPWIEHGGPTTLFADGGAGKSVLALILAVSIASGEPLLGDGAMSEPVPVLYLDWETSADVHAARLRAICRAAGITEPVIYYQRMTASLAESAQSLRRRCGEMGAGFVIVDSLGAARSGEPESAESTIKLFNAGRSLGLPWLAIDHVTKNGGETKTRPFGSTYTHNLSRLTWSMEQPETETGAENEITVVLTNRKANNGRLQRRRGYALSFTESEDGTPIGIEVRARDIRDIPSMIRRFSVRDQIAAVLRANNATLTVDDIQSSLEADNIIVKAEVLRATLNRYKQLFVAVAGPDRATKWGLLTMEVRPV